MTHNYSIIMAGGVGSRFWPMSRTAMPKQFLDMLGTGKSLIRQTFERLLLVSPAEQIYVVTNKAYKDLVLEHLPELQADQVLLEPVMRNTAPCIAYATYKIAGLDPEARMVVAPSDHLITNEKQFQEIIELALDETSSTDRLVTLGIQPSRPDTGYGYIRYSDRVLAPFGSAQDASPHSTLSGAEGHSAGAEGHSAGAEGHSAGVEGHYGENGLIKKVEQFTEKPDAETAQQFLDSGDYAWNSGIFIWSLKNIRRNFEQHLPDMAKLFSDGQAKLNTSDEQAFIDENFGKCDNISIDYGIMERAEEVSVVLSDFGWSDLGTWGSLSTHLTPDAEGNTSPRDNVRYYGSSDNTVNIPEGKLAVLQGLDGYIVVQTEKALLVCKKEDEQLIKQFVGDLKKDGLDSQY